MNMTPAEAIAVFFLFCWVATSARSTYWRRRFHQLEAEVQQLAKEPR